MIDEDVCAWSKGQDRKQCRTCRQQLHDQSGIGCICTAHWVSTNGFTLVRVCARHLIYTIRSKHTILDIQNVSSNSTNICILRPYIYQTLLVKVKLTIVEMLYVEHIFTDAGLIHLNIHLMFYL